MHPYWLLGILLLIGFSALFGGLMAGAVIAFRNHKPILCAGFVIALIPACYLLLITLGFFGFVPLNVH